MTNLLALLRITITRVTIWSSLSHGLQPCQKALSYCALTFGQWCENLQGEMNQYGIYEELFERRLVGELTYEQGRQTAMVDYNKNYPTTVYENKRILAEYVDFLEEKGVKPIVVVMPATSYYTKYCDLGLKARFYSDLQEIIGSKKIQVLDYFDKLDYPDEYWYHVNHFNKTGAEIFTRQLIKDIEW